MTFARLSRLLLFTSCLSTLSWAGSIFLTGHDPDFHADDSVGAQHINQVAISFIEDPGFNPFSATIHKFLFVQSNISVPGGHRDGKNGLIASGYSATTDFDTVDASSLNTALDGLGTLYRGLVVASDFGGILTAAELTILNSRSPDIIHFLNNGGGLYAMAESNGGAGLTGNLPKFGFLPFVVTSTQLNEGEGGDTVTPFGASLGLTNSDVNSNFSHNVFTSASGMNIVDVDASGHILSLAVRSQVTSSGVVPEPSTWVLFGSAGLALLRAARRRAESPCKG